MMPFFALAMIESRLVRMFDDLKNEIGEDDFAGIQKDDLYDLIKDKGQGYNIFIFEKKQSLTDICLNDKSFEIDFDAYLKGFDGETKDLLGVDAGDGEKFLDIKGVITKLKAKKILLGYSFRRGLMQNYETFAVFTSNALDYGELLLLVHHPQNRGEAGFLSYTLPKLPDVTSLSVALTTAACAVGNDILSRRTDA